MGKTRTSIKMKAKKAVPVVALTEEAPSKPQHYIREWRKHRNQTIYDLAETVDMNASTVAQIERGYSRYTQRTLELFAAALQVETWKLLAYPPTREKAFRSELQDAPREGLFEDIDADIMPLVDAMHRYWMDVATKASIESAKQMAPMLKKVAKKNGVLR